MALPLKMRAALAAALVLVVCGNADAHHSLAGQFDVKKTITIVGVVSKVDWVNPHIYVHVDVKDEAGKVATWRLEGVPVAMARKAGVSKAMLLGNGETVTVVAFPARDGTPNLGFIMKITYPDGHFYQFNPDPRERAAG
jgi:hypothetical protein